MLGLLTSCVIALLLGRPKPEVVAIAIETCFQNTAIALTVALATFSTDVLRAEATGIPIVYQFGQVTMLAIFALGAWRLGWTHTPAGVNFFTCLVRNYQPAAERAPAANDTAPAPPPAAAAQHTTPLPRAVSMSQVGISVVEVAGAPAAQDAKSGRSPSGAGGAGGIADAFTWLRQAIGFGGGVAAPAAAEGHSHSGR